MARSRASLVAALSLGLAGCGLVPTETSEPSDWPPVECRGVPRDACEGFADAWQDVPGVAADEVVRVIVTCRARACDRGQGDVDIAVVLNDGSVVWVGGGGYAEPVEVASPEATASIPANVVVACRGLAPQQCREQAQGAYSFLTEHLSREPSQVIRITVRCDGTCNSRSGRGETTIELADEPSVRSSWEYSWENP